MKMTCCKENIIYGQQLINNIISLAFCWFVCLFVSVPTCVSDMYKGKAINLGVCFTFKATDIEWRPRPYESAGTYLNHIVIYPDSCEPGLKPLWIEKGFKNTRSRWTYLLVSCGQKPMLARWCGRKANSCNNISGFKNIWIHVERGLRIQLNSIFAWFPKGESCPV